MAMPHSLNVLLTAIYCVIVAIVVYFLLFDLDGSGGVFHLLN
jgi:hypothetical protein